MESSIVINVMSDNCSQNTFILEAKAKELNCKGSKISYILVCTDGSRSQKSGWLYDVSLLDKDGIVHTVQAIGIDKLSSAFLGFKIRNIRNKVKDGRQRTTHVVSRHANQ